MNKDNEVQNLLRLLANVGGRKGSEYRAGSVLHLLKRHLTLSDYELLKKLHLDTLKGKILFTVLPTECNKMRPLYADRPAYTPTVPN